MESILCEMVRILTCISPTKLHALVQNTSNKSIATRDQPFNLTGERFSFTNFILGGYFFKMLFIS